MYIYTYIHTIDVKYDFNILMMHQTKQLNIFLVFFYEFHLWQPRHHQTSGSLAELRRAAAEAGKTLDDVNLEALDSISQ